jgi:hypothetical protein
VQVSIAQRVAANSVKLQLPMCNASWNKLPIASRCSRENPPLLEVSWQQPGSQPSQPA